MGFKSKIDVETTLDSVEKALIEANRVIERFLLRQKKYSLKGIGLGLLLGLIGNIIVFEGVILSVSQFNNSYWSNLIIFTASLTLSVLGCITIYKEFREQETSIKLLKELFKTIIEVAREE